MQRRTSSRTSTLLFLFLSSTVLLDGGSEAAAGVHHDDDDGEHDQLESSDRVLRLPGQPSHPPISQFSGYITVNRKNGRALFYWFFEALSQPSQKPLLLWLNGGPGCSSVGYGAAAELGPLRVKANGTGLEFNKFAWNNEANLLFLESPVGVGFSYTNTTSDLSRLDDSFVAEDAYNFIVNWLRRFPQYQKHDFYISGESYAGHYVPQLAEIVHDRSKDKKNLPRINFKGFIVGNPETEDLYDSKGLVEYAWSHAVISDRLYHHITNACDFALPSWTDRCGRAMTHLFRDYKQIDIYNIYAPKCLLPEAASSSPAPSALGRQDDHRSRTEDEEGRTFRRMRMPAGGYDPCFSVYAEQYFNRDDVRGALHGNAAATDHSRWKVCNDSILQTYNFTVASVLPIYSKLVKAGLRIWVYSGDADGRVPVIGTRYCVEALKLPVKTSWRPWFHEHQVAGRFVEYEGLTMVTVRGAGHLVPLNKPSESLRLISTFLSGHQLPTARF